MNLVPEYYLESGNKTTIGENVKKLASLISGENSEETIKQIMYIMSTKVHMEKDSTSPKKFRRTADEIVGDRRRNGCCDSSTLFVSLCRAKGIPAVQIISIDIPSAKEKKYSKGHFFSGCYLKEKGEWFWIDSNLRIKNMNEVELNKWDTDSKIINKDFYIFACERDYSDFEIDGIHIDSIHNMNEIHRKICKRYGLDKEELELE